MVKEATRHAGIFCNQVEYHPYRGQDKLLEQAKELDYLLTACQPISGGRSWRMRRCDRLEKATARTRRTPTAWS